MVSPKLQPLSIDEMKAELHARSNNLSQGLAKDKARKSVIREPRPDIADIASHTIVEEIKKRQKVIYDNDDRVDIRLVKDPFILENAAAVAAIFKLEDITDNGNGTVSIPRKTLKQDFAEKGTPLCEGESFINQPAGAICTAFLIAPNIIATAGHCLNENNLHLRRFIFGYQMLDEYIAAENIAVENIYAGIEILGWELDENGPDWAIVRLDREVSGIRPLRIRKQGKVPDRANLYVLGHPIGLPLKYAGNAEVRGNQHKDYFVSNLDTFAGNSGSPVLNAATHEVEGILVRGETDFAPQGSCIVSLICPVQGCRGEDCTRITLIAGILA